MSTLKSEIKLGALVEEAPEGSPPSPPPPARSPSGRLREKIARDSSSSVSKGQSNASPVESSPATSIGSDRKELPEVVSTDEMAEAAPPQLVSTSIDNAIENEMMKKSKLDSSNQVPVSVNIDKKIADISHINQIYDHHLQLAQRGFHLDVSNSPEAESSRPGAFSVAGIGQQNDAGAVPSVPSIVMDVEDLPIAAELAEEGRPVEASKLEDVVVNYRSRKVRIGIFVLFVVLTGAIIGGVLGSQKRKEAALDECIVEDPTKLGNGECDGDEYNSEKCNWDEGDCLLLNQFSSCALTPKQSAKLGDGFCDGLPWFSEECGDDAGDCDNCTPAVTFYSKNWKGNEGYRKVVGDGRCDHLLNTLECSWDGGDCFIESHPSCHIPFPSTLGDGKCDAYANNVECEWDRGDCLEFNEKYPSCTVDLPRLVGNGRCDGLLYSDGGEYNSVECGWDGRDCLDFNQRYPNCQVDNPNLVGDGICDGYDYNTIECAWDGGDCTEFNEKYPGCLHVGQAVFIGDGSCNGEYNKAECGWDGGDCDAFNKMLMRTYPECSGGIDPILFSEGQCDGYAPYHTIECGWDGGDCTPRRKYPNCNAVIGLVAGFIGDGSCDGGDLNTEECGWDGGDCDFFNSLPDCHVKYPWKLGDGRCDNNYNIAKCGWDGGDCSTSTEINFTICIVENIEYLADGECDGGEFNVQECEWDGGDCTEFNKLYPDCHASEAYWIGDGECDGGDYNTAECGWDGGDCLEFNMQYPNCEVNYPTFVGDGECNGAEYNTAECGWDGGDCK